MAAVLESQAADIRVRMARMYRPQKYIYDVTRKYYLVGRDRLIAGLDLASGQTLLDVGCGTGRNLALIGRRYPKARLFGLDAAEPMLEVAAARLARDGIQATLAHGTAETLDPGATFGIAGGFDRVTISYCLSMVDDPESALRAAAGALAPGGSLHVVDFGDMAELPRWFAALMRTWLGKFHVHHRPEVERTLAALAREQAAVLERIAIGRRYALLFRLRLPTS